MARYLVQFSYTSQGMAGLQKEGGSARRKAVEQLVKSLGGTLEAYYYEFGSHDGFTILQLPDNTAMAAASIVVAAGGGATTQTTVLLTPEELDEAVKRSATYRAPGR
jgi:uncharacterized protein with GYD domain